MRRGRFVSIFTMGVFTYENFFSAEVYQKMTETFLEDLAPYGKYLKFPRGHVLNHLRVGEMAVVLSGSINLKLLSLYGEEVSLFRMEKGTILGENEYFLKQASTLVAETASNVELSLVPSPLVKQRLEENDRLRLACIQSIIRKMNLITFTLADICFNDAKGRLASLILRQDYLRKKQLLSDEGVGRYTQEEYASRLNLHRVTVTRAMTELEEAGLIAVRGGKITVLKREGLQALIHPLGVENVEGFSFWKGID